MQLEDSGTERCCIARLKGVCALGVVVYVGVGRGNGFTL